MTGTTERIDPTVIFEEMRSLFCDLRFFEGSVAAQLKLAIADITKNSIDINFATVKKFAHRYYTTGVFVTKEAIEMWKEIQWIFTTCCVLVVSKRSEMMDQFWDNHKTLLEHYPSFSNANPHEMELLLRFRNMVVAALHVVSPRLNKQLLIYIAGRLEGTQRRYVTGSGMSEAVKRRVAIYEREGKVEPEQRPERINSVIRSIQIKRDADIRKASVARRMAEEGELVHPTHSETFSTSTQAGHRRVLEEDKKNDKSYQEPVAKRSHDQMSRDGDLNTPTAAQTMLVDCRKKFAVNIVSGDRVPIMKKLFFPSGDIAPADGENHTIVIFSFKCSEQQTLQRLLEVLAVEAGGGTNHGLSEGNPGDGRQDSIGVSSGEHSVTTTGSDEDTGTFTTPDQSDQSVSDELFLDFFFDPEEEVLPVLN